MTAAGLSLTVGSASTRSKKASIARGTPAAVAPLPTLTAPGAAAVVQLPARTAPEAAAVVQPHARTAPVRRDCIQRHKAVMLVFTQCPCRMCRWSPVHPKYKVGRDYMTRGAILHKALLCVTIKDLLVPYFPIDLVLGNIAEACRGAPI